MDMAKHKSNPYAVIPPALLQRNKKMIRMVSSGTPIVEVASMFGLSRQRVLQIVQRGK